MLTIDRLRHTPPATTCHVALSSTLALPSTLALSSTLAAYARLSRLRGAV